MLASFVVLKTAAQDLGEKEGYTFVLQKLTPILESSFQQPLHCSILFIGLAIFIYKFQWLDKLRKKKLVICQCFSVNDHGMTKE